MKFKVGDRVRIIEDHRSNVPRADAAGIISSTVEYKTRYSITVLFDDGRKRHFCDDELELDKAQLVRELIKEINGV